MPSMRARTSACRHRRRRPAAAHVAAASAAPANSIPATALPATATAARARRHSCARVRQFGEDRDDVGADLVRLARGIDHANTLRSEEHTSELQSLMRISYAVFCLNKKKQTDMKSQDNRA